MKRLLFIPLLGLTLLILSCDSPTGDAEQATLPEPPTLSADVTIAGGQGEGVFAAEVKYPWPGCGTTATQVNGDWELSRGSGNYCLYAHVTDLSSENVTRGQVVWEHCVEYRDGMGIDKAECAAGNGVWIKLGGQGGGTKVNEEGAAIWSSNSTGTCGGGDVPPIGYRYQFKGGGQVAAGISAPFNVTVKACAS